MLTNCERKLAPRNSSGIVSGILNFYSLKAPNWLTVRSDISNRSMLGSREMGLNPFLQILLLTSSYLTHFEWHNALANCLKRCLLILQLTSVKRTPYPLTDCKMVLFIPDEKALFLFKKKYFIITKTWKKIPTAFVTLSCHGPISLFSHLEPTRWIKITSL